mmetsp:Transcript_22996/g.54580  ORF Transcript_22996/g.54580 Transcript_22996/m.54580 type:complete len:365 (+) Transcript_22996:34-1128(+)
MGSARSSTCSKSGAVMLRFLCAVTVSSNVATILGFVPQPQQQQEGCSTREQRRDPLLPSRRTTAPQAGEGYGQHHHHHHHHSASSSWSSSSLSLYLQQLGREIVTLASNTNNNMAVTHCCSGQQQQPHGRKVSLYQTISDGAQLPSSTPVDDILPNTTVDANSAPSGSNSSVVMATATRSSTPYHLDTQNYARMKIPDRGTDNGHAIFGVLHNEGLIERYEIWKKKENENEEQEREDVQQRTAASLSDDENVIVAFVSFGHRLNGHVGIVHGGILSLVVDDLCGFAFEAIGVQHAVTANLSLNYRSPVPENTTMKITIQLHKREGRKLYWTVQMTSLDGTRLYVEATSLYIVPRSAAVSTQHNQ